MNFIKKILFYIIPNSIINIFIRKNNNIGQIEKRDEKFRTLNNKDIFSIIYKDRLWGFEENQEFYSGPGSHESKITKPYIKCIIQQFKKYSDIKTVLDLGCGDFNIGQELFQYVNKYIGLDVVEKLINRNKSLYLDTSIEFYCKDIVQDELPDGDCVLIREVLQHLTNSEIAKILNKIIKYKFVIITENIPYGTFKSNMDKIKGPESRHYLQSGVVIEDPPFNFIYKHKKELLKLQRPGIGYLITNLYEIS